MGLAWVDASEIVADSSLVVGVVGDEDQLRAADIADEEETWRFDDRTVDSSFAVEAAMLAAVEEVAILFEQEVATAGLAAAMVVVVEEGRHIGHCSAADLDRLLGLAKAHRDEDLVSATSIGLGFEERERLGCARCRPG